MSNPDVLYLNSAFMPPSNLLVHGAFHASPTKHCTILIPRHNGSRLQRRLAPEPSTLSFTRDTTDALGSHPQHQVLSLRKCCYLGHGAS
jgi:hypothetical protein